MGASATQTGLSSPTEPCSTVSALRASIPSADPVCRSLYEPATGRIACVLIQAAYNLDRRPCHFFGPGDWNTDIPHESAMIVSAPLSQWRQVGLMDREERVRRFASAMSASGQDPKGLEAKPASAAPEGGDAR